MRDNPSFEFEEISLRLLTMLKSFSIGFVICFSTSSGLDPAQKVMIEIEGGSIFGKKSTGRRQ
jgi:hypothetical protein